MIHVAVYNNVLHLQYQVGRNPSLPILHLQKNPPISLVFSLRILSVKRYVTSFELFQWASLLSAILSHQVPSKSKTDNFKFHIIYEFIHPTEGLLTHSRNYQYFLGITIPSDYTESFKKVQNAFDYWSN